MSLSSISPSLLNQYQTLCQSSKEAADKASDVCLPAQNSICEIEVNGVKIVTTMERKEWPTWESGYVFEDTTIITINPPNNAVERAVVAFFENESTKLLLTGFPISHHVCVNGQKLGKEVEQISSLLSKQHKHLCQAFVSDCKQSENDSQTYLIDTKFLTSLHVEMKREKISTWESEENLDTINVTISPANESVKESILKHFKKKPTIANHDTWTPYRILKINNALC